MKNLTIKNHHEYEKLWNSLEAIKSQFILWQLEVDGSRRVKFFKFDFRDKDKEVLRFLEQNGQGEPFIIRDLYAYNEEFGFIFKTNILTIEGSEIYLSSPLVLKMLDPEDIHFIQGLADMDLAQAPWRVKRLDNSAEEEVYSEIREAPRARPRVEKKVALYKSGYIELRAEFNLFDISRGGLSFLVADENQFRKGDFLEIAALEGEELEIILIGEVMSVRSQDDSWKVGIKFIDKIPAQET